MNQTEMSEGIQPPDSSLEQFLNSLETTTDEQERLQKKSELYRTFYYRYGDKPLTIGDKDYFQRVRSRGLPQGHYKMFSIGYDLSTNQIWDNAELREREILDKDGKPLLHVASVPVTETIEAVLTPRTIVGTTDLTACTGIWTHKELETREVSAMLSHIQMYSPGSVDNFMEYAALKGYPRENTRLLLPSHEEGDLVGLPPGQYYQDFERKLKQDMTKHMKERNIGDERVWRYRQPWIVGDLKLTPAVVLTSEGFTLHSAGQQFPRNIQLWKK